MILGPLPGLRAGRGTLDDYLDGVTIHRLCTLPFASISQKVVWFTFLGFNPKWIEPISGFSIAPKYALTLSGSLPATSK
jgi:hypothetical protein